MFLKDDSGRVPFSAIGVLLLSASIVVVAMLVRLDTQIARETAREPEISESAELLAAAKADLARLLSWSVQGAAADVGRAPVVAGMRGPLPGGATPEECAESEECVFRFNEERVRRGALERMRGYLETANFTYRQGESRARVGVPLNWTNLTLAPVNMTLERAFQVPAVSPGEGPYAAHWLAQLPVEFTVRSPELKGGVHEETSDIETFVPGRHPLVRDLAEEFARDRVNGSLFWEFTGASLGQVWVKGYLQWAARGGEDVYGDRGNSDVERVLNLVLLMDEGLQFQSVDPDSLRALLPEKVQRGLETVGEIAETAGRIVDVGERVEELLAGDGAAEARTKMREPRSAAEFFTCPLGPGADIPTGEERAACSASPEKERGPCGLCGSDEIRTRIDTIVKQVYSAEVRTDISRQAGSAGSCPSASGWRYVSHSCSATAAPSGALGADRCSVTYTRTCTETQGETTTTYAQFRTDSVEARFVATDYARTSLDLSAAGLPGASRSDVAGAFSHTVFENKPDPNLDGALSEYKRQAWTSADQRSILESASASGSYNARTVPADRPDWLQGAAVEEVTSLLGRLKDIRTRPETTPENITHYGDYLRNMSRELSEGTKERGPGFADRPRFADDGTYKSAAAKTLYLARAWFLDHAVRHVKAMGEKGAGEIDSKLGDLLKSAKGEPGAAERAGDALRSAGEFLKGEAQFPLHLNMTLDTSPEEFRFPWNETVRLNVDREPDRLGAEAGGDAGFIPLSIRTWSADSAGVTWPPTLHGGWGILPPPFPWVVTANAWVVNVKGEFELTVEDAGEKVWNGEGFEGAGWVRRDDPKIEDRDTGQVLGDNSRIKFEFWTVIPIVVPPGPIGVGDRLGNPTTCSGEFKC